MKGYLATGEEADAKIIADNLKHFGEPVYEYDLAQGVEDGYLAACEADDVAAAINNLYAQWCVSNGKARLDPYAFKCTASVGGADYIADLRGGSRHHFVATTVDLLTTGVDVPVVRNIAFFKYVRSPLLSIRWWGGAAGSMRRRAS